jgi:tetratricopeptide (TPR) repeat protein
VRRRLTVLTENDTGRFLFGIARMIECAMLRREGRFDESLAAWVEGDAALAELGGGPAGFLREVGAAEPAWLAHARGDLETAETVLRERYDALGAAGETAFRSTMAIQLGEIAYAKGRVDEAEALAFEGVALGGPDDITNLVLGPALRAKILADRGDTDAALALAEDAVALTQGTDLPDMVAAAWGALGHVRRARGELAESRAAYEQELAVFETCGDVVWAERTRRLLVEL